MQLVLREDAPNFHRRVPAKPVTTASNSIRQPAIVGDDSHDGGSFASRGSPLVAIPKIHRQVFPYRRSYDRSPIASDCRAHVRSRLLDFRGAWASGGSDVARRSPARLISDVRRLLERQHAVASSAPLACCDACLALQFRVSLAEATEAAETLAGEPGFQRQQAICETCGRMLEFTSITVRLQRHN